MRCEMPRICQGRVGRCVVASAVAAAGIIMGLGLSALPPALGGAGSALGGESNSYCTYVITGAGFSPTQPGTTCNQYQVGEKVYTEPCPATGCPYQNNWAIYNGVCEYPAELANPPCQTP
jgi:hypothetical protein